MSQATDIKNNSDTYFKFVFSKKEHVQAFLEAFFPHLACHLRLQTIEINPTEKYLIASNEKLYLDFAINCKIKDKDAKIYIIIEHKSRPDKRVIIQLLRYITAIWQDDILNKRDLTPVIPIVFYNGKSTWKIPTSTKQIFADIPEDLRDYILQLNYLLFDINQIADEDIKKAFSYSKILTVALDAMRGMQNCKEAEIIKIMKELALLIAEHKAEFKEDIAMFMQMTIKYIQQSCKIKPEEFNKIVTAKEDEAMRTVLDLWQEQGLKQGMIKSAQDMLIAAIEAKLDTIPEDINAQIRKIQDSAYLQDLLKKVVKSSDVIETLNKHLAIVH